MLIDSYEVQSLTSVVGPFATACGVSIPSFTTSTDITAEELAELKRKYSGLLIVFDRFRDHLIASDSMLHPSTTEWSIREILGHMVDTDRNIWWPRIDRILAEDRPYLSSVDQLGLIDEHNWNDQPVERILAQFMQFRWNSAIKARDLTLEDVSRTGEHYEFGPISVSNILELLVAHDAHFLSKLRHRLGIPEF
jgi:hypothetical protein